MSGESPLVWPAKISGKLNLHSIPNSKELFHGTNRVIARLLIREVLSAERDVRRDIDKRPNIGRPPV